MRRVFVGVTLTTLLTGCLTTSGVYKLSAVDKQGRPVATQFNLIAQGTGIYSMRNALCAAYPGSTVYIKSTSDGENLDSESPYQCR